VSEPREQQKRLEGVPLQIALLDEIAERLSRIEEKVRQVPKGVLPIIVEVKDLCILNFLTNDPFSRLFSLTLYNDGPDPVYPGINIAQSVTMLKPGEDLRIDLEYPGIERLYLSVARGKRALIRGFGVY